ncbi:hypothetical protein NDU88_001213 [Pleurodeles waltl]|uniref:Uncharacterized protein n=1 Tax=Pleurodeles waltl TaxID=8319 RepID=A0AAV7VZT1_PLEWA|nr:hypothetical protein NDU88_001213 [Pleurodeles waltl]
MSALIVKPVLFGWGVGMLIFPESARVLSVSCAVFTSAMHIVSESLAGVMPVRALEEFDSFLVSKKSVISRSSYRFPWAHGLLGLRVLRVLPACLAARHRASNASGAEAPQAPALQAPAERAAAGCCGLLRALKPRPTPTRLGPLRRQLLSLGLPGCRAAELSAGPPAPEKVRV